MNRKYFLILAFLLNAIVAQASPSAQGDFLVTEARALQGDPAVAYDQNRDRFLTTWTDYRNKESTELDIYGRIVDAGGKPVTGDFPISKAKRGQSISAVAFDPLSNRYLVVWNDWRNAISTDSDIYGQLVNADGTLYGADFIIAGGRFSKKRPAVKFDPVRRRFLVVWADARDNKVEKLYGRFVDSTGTHLGRESRLVAEGGNQDRPSLAYSEKSKKFFVIWRDSEVTGIYGAFVDPDLGPQARTLIAPEPEGCLPPSLYAISYSAKADLFFAAWTSGRNYHKKSKHTVQGLDVYGVFLRGEDGKPQGRDFPIAAETDYQEYAAVAYDSNQDRFLTVWYDLRRPPTARSMDIYGRFIAPGGKLSEEFLVSESQMHGIRRFPAIAFSPKSDAFFVLWEDGRSREKHGRYIYGKIR